ncbi:MAG: PD-(D/E)XK nuclease family protein [Gammaproteobacteria bacterium]|nr:PD-(D/E)XK nuclease family protein [Gammaproteobacteria bacterium]
MSLFLHAYSEDLLARAAERCLYHAAAQCPDLSRVVVLVADSLASRALRVQISALAQARGHPALLGLRILTLRAWIDNGIDNGIENGSPDSPDTDPPLSDPARHLLLVDALRQHSGLFGEDDPWRLADSLLELFDELTLHRAELPETAPALAERLAKGYRIDGSAPAALNREAQIVHRLWRAWQEQTAALHRPDPGTHYLHKLQRQHPLREDEPFYILVGLQTFTPAEHEWITARLHAGRAEWLLHGNLPAQHTLADRALNDILTLGTAQYRADDNADNNAIRTFLDSVYPHDDADLRTRAAALASANADSPAPDKLGTLAADSAEQEARAIDLQVRRWLLAGKQRIGIVTEDRRLARRVRALLERAGIVLQDAGGWALSTTSAAACVERWLQSMEEDFAHQPLLDFLKSSCACAEATRSAHLATVYRLEHDIIQHENIARGLERYRRHIEYRRHRLDWPPAIVEPLHALLDRLATAARPLLRMLNRAHPARMYLATLRDSLTTLGVWTSLDGDDAGQRILALWEELDAAAQTLPLSLSWREFRTWFGRALEDKTFRPSLANGPVQLLTLEQSQSLHFDALVCGACDREHLPGKDRISAFFNAGVRRELGLPTWEQRLDLRRYQFRHLLESAPQILLTWRREEQGEPVLPSPWLEALESLHRLAYGRSLEDIELKALTVSEQGAVAPADAAPLPAPPTRPRPRLPADLLPATVSASSHQHLIDCPYRYFAADGLRLSPPDEVRERLQKSDYGERVHRCLEAFHGNVEHLPGPFTQAFSAATRDAAIDLLQRIAHAVFARDLEDNFQHRGWLKRWLVLIPDYIDWQIARAANWRVEQVEAQLERPLENGLTLKGRLDRIDSDGQHRAIVDYKTGYIPAQAAIDAGEAVQLPMYALLGTSAVEHVEYLQLDKQTVRSAGQLSGAAVMELRDAVAARLAATHSALLAGQALPAWGDPDSCRHCPMQGVCRRAAWDNDNNPSTL